jgi:hypothetical protein
MTSLLEFVEIKTNKNPLMMASPIAPDLDGPFLVSSSKGFIWVEKKFSGNFIRAATRVDKVQDMFENILNSILEKSVDMEWGSVKPFTEKGVKESILYLSYFGFAEFDLILNSDSPFSFKDKPENLFVSWESWVPEGCAVLTPTDKSYLGTIYSFGNGNFSCCVHNPSRGICILKN